SWALHQEVAKLCAYAKSSGLELVNLAMIKELVSGSIEDHLFDFLDACMQGKAATAVNLLEHIVSTGTNELQILAMLQRQISSLVGVKDLLERGITDRNEVARRLGIHPYPAGKIMVAARFVSNQHLKALMNDLLEIEYRFKTGFGRIKVELGLFTTRIANQQAQ
ncbi:hypothetical protein KKC47_04345, partial [Patescibacteria group bacterium]|nr:hypothetical protein [Patescibacteria group bacterium]